MEGQLEVALLDVQDRIERGENVSEAWIRETYPRSADHLLEILRAEDHLVSLDLRDDRSGQALAGYEILDEIGRGAMGVVYRARDRKLGRTVALKVLSAAGGWDDRAVARFRREARIVAGLSHPNVLPLYEFGEAQGAWYYAMELVGGRSLLQEIQAARRQGRSGLFDGDAGRLDEILLRFAELADALHAMHERGICHRDVKPSNILVAEDGTHKLTDFGLARAVTERTLTRTGEIVGTITYMSPEQARGLEADARSDVYSLGMTLYQALTLHPPLAGISLPDALSRIVREMPPRPKALGLHLPAALEAIVYKAVAKEPARRYSSSAELAEDIRRFVESGRSRAPPRGVGWRLRRPPKLVVALAAPLILALVLFVVWSVFPTAAERMFAVAQKADGAERARRLEHLVKQWPDSPPALRAYRELGAWYDAQDDWEEGQKAWALAYLRDPRGEVGLGAYLCLGRSISEEGRFGLGGMVAAEVLAAATQPEIRARAHLLGAEAALARGEKASGRAFWHMAEAHEAREHLPRADRRRLDEMHRVARAFLPARRIEIAAAERSCVGRPRTGLPRLLVLTKNRPVLFRWQKGDVVPDGVEGLPEYQESRAAMFADLGGDNLEELVLLRKADEPEVLVLEVFDLREERAIRLASIRLPDGDYRGLGVGDVNDDRRQDLLLPGSYPNRISSVYLNGGDFRFEEADPGDLAEIGPKTDAVQMTTADVDGDGRAELVVATMAHELYALVLYRFDERERAFRRIRQFPIGFVAGCPVIDADEDGLEEVVFCTGHQDHLSAIPRYEGFEPQGVYFLDFDRTQREYRLEPVRTYRRLLPEPSRVSARGRSNFGFGYPVVGRRASTGPFVVAYSWVFRGRRRVAPLFRLFTLGKGPTRGIPISPVLSTQYAATGDLNGDGDEEIVLPEPDGVRVFGLGGEVALHTPEAAAPPRVAPTEGAEFELELARLLLRFKLFDAAFEVMGDVVRRYPRTAAGRSALTEMILGYVQTGDYEEAHAVIERHARGHAEDAPLVEFLRAILDERTGNLEDAARRYARAAASRTVYGSDLDLAQERAGQLAAWQAPETREVQGPDGWLVSDPGRNRLHEPGAVEAADTEKGRTQAWLPVAFDGSSFQLSFELTIEELGYDQGYEIGLVTANRDGAGGIYIAGLSTSSTRNAINLCYRASDEPASTDVASAFVHADLPSSTPLEIQLTYLANLRRLGLRVRNRITGELVCCHEIQDLPAFQAFPQRLTVSLRGGRNPGPVRLHVTGFRFRFPKGGGFDLGVEDPTATAYHRANAALARGDTEAARGLYREFVDATPATATGEDRVLAALSLAILEWRVSPDEETRARILAVAEEAGHSLDDLLAGRVFLLTAEELSRWTGK